MKPQLYVDFKQCISQAEVWLRHRSNIVHTQRWQGTDITQMPEMATFEVANCSFGVSMERYDRATYGLGIARNNMVEDLQPNMPWAEDHFQERVCGAPINPGTQWKHWPYGHSASKFLDEDGKFNHNYMERYWPKLAGTIDKPTRDATEFQVAFAHEQHSTNPGTNFGIKYQYGDLNDVVALLAEDPLTRQAYLPIWFPEDTGGGSKRAPCTIGYHFLIRDNRLHINYHIRSCDFVRHFRDDCYLTVRLAQWVVDRLYQLGRIGDVDGEQLIPSLSLGNFYMQIGSLHMFKNDYLKLWGNRG